ncbi:lytic transglycosylase domain-containing protein [Candidatus Igneacidithiobacillus taiwanensis]|uniref:lytic transglycosylase domain-containing protein n=1 Tax=Candidatus Igneacidithiobacillus taiwanensis TaxID=1945924 RepID=UPI00289A76F4|nr:lytic transglycosylase domain-containing protein [Candidatus Igneacidithiobacillus taiwanensis]
MIPVSTLVQQCAPEIAPATMTAIVRVESGGNPWVLWDNTANRGYHPKSRQEALRILRILLAAGHQVDVGIAQVDSENFAQYHLTPKTALNACRNLQAGAQILQADWQQALSRGMTGQAALYHAFEAYNSGHLFGDSVYAKRVLGAAGSPVFLPVANLSASGKYPATWPQYVWTAKQSDDWSVMP